MSYGTAVCSKCGGEVRIYDGAGGTCPNCGHWCSTGTYNEDQARIDRMNERKAIREMRMKNVIRVEVLCAMADGDRLYEWGKDFDTVEEAREWARTQQGSVTYNYYDKDGRIE